MHKDSELLHGHFHSHEEAHTHMHKHEIDHRPDPAADQDHAHGHTHSHTQTRAVVNRLSRAIGHLEHVKRMVEEGRDCTEVLIQLAAVRSALNSTAKVILKDHLEHCIADAEQTGSDQLQALNAAIDKFMS